MQSLFRSNINNLRFLVIFFKLKEFLFAKLSLISLLNWHLFIKGIHFFSYAHINGVQRFLYLVLLVSIVTRRAESALVKPLLYFILNIQVFFKLLTFALSMKYNFFHFWKFSTQDLKRGFWFLDFFFNNLECNFWIFLLLHIDLINLKLRFDFCEYWRFCIFLRCILKLLWF